MPAQRSSVLLCDIGPSGQLLELGVDPLLSRAAIKTIGVQTESERGATLLDKIVEIRDGGTKTLARQHAAPPLASSAQVLKVAVGLLGLDLHEKPHPWAEAWLTFQDVTAQKLGLSSFGEGQGPAFGGGGDSPVAQSPAAAHAKDNASTISLATSPNSGTVDKNSQLEWQMRVLSHLRRLFDTREGGGPGLTGAGDEAAGAGNCSQMLSDWGAGASVASLGNSASPFREQLDLSEFCLRRITHAVNILQDPEQNDRPMLLREYTEDMVMEVCKDLRQWLEQLAVLLSLYHVHILDLESQKCQLADKLKTTQSKYDESDNERKDAVARFTVISERWEEEKMKRRAEALLGIKVMGEDAKIYSQREVDDMMKDWQKEHLDPLLEEIRELRLARDELLAKLQGSGKQIKRPGKEETDDSGGGLGRQMLGLLKNCMVAVSGRVEDEALSKLIGQLGDAIVGGGGRIPDVLAQIEALPFAGAGKPATPPTTVTEGKPGSAKALTGGGNYDELAPCFAFLFDEAKGLEGGLRGLGPEAGMDKIRNWVMWLRESLDLLKNAKPGGAPKLKTAPKWSPLNLGAEKPSTRAIGVQKDGLPPAKGQPEVVEVERPRSSHDDRDWQAELDRLRRDLEAKLKAALDEAERQRLKAEEAMRKLAEETARADKMLNELRKRLQEMERLLQKAGLGQEAADAIYEAGLADFMQGRDVFDRLYRDALRRMRTQAEAQARLLEQSSADFMRVLHDLSLNPMAAIEMASEYLGGRRDSAQQRSPSPLQVRRLSDPRAPEPLPPAAQPSRDVSPGRLHAARALAAVESLQNAGKEGVADAGLMLISGLGPRAEKGEDGQAAARVRAKTGASAAVQYHGPPPAARDELPALQGAAMRAPMGGNRTAATAAAADGVERGRAQVPASRSQSPPIGSRSPSAAALGGYGHGGQLEGLPPQFVISAVGPRPAPSRLLPPSMSGGGAAGGAGIGSGQVMRGSPSLLKTRPMAVAAATGSRGHTPNSLILKSAGSLSMPQLSPPRLLVQSLG
eukprot:TRINITY_DN27816_c0_g1_i1.p1 TRINITY_DN27816_c0_g1~~TRINITY_DN27816_c0_g1_i1.p1  ORF type:complete len:1026 (+),score=244.33 TRINITY_DN27816_c0_g1_i1:33-3110(+)